MLLNIQHETVYRYSAPVDYTIQHLRLTPRHGRLTGSLSGANQA